MSPLSCLMRVKKLTGLFPAMISTALQVSLRAERPRSHPGASCSCSRAAVSLSVLSQLPGSHRRLSSGGLNRKIRAVLWAGKGSRGVASLWIHPPPPRSLSLCLQSVSAASLGCRLETAAAGCHSDGAFAQHPSNSAALAEVGREKNIPGKGLRPPAGVENAGLGKLRYS